MRHEDIGKVNFSSILTNLFCFSAIFKPNLFCIGPIFKPNLFCIGPIFKPNLFSRRCDFQTQFILHRPDWSAKFILRRPDWSAKFILRRPVCQSAIINHQSSIASCLDVSCIPTARRCRGCPCVFALLKWIECENFIAPSATKWIMQWNTDLQFFAK